MKKLIYFFVSGIIIFSGCSKSSINSPEIESKSLGKVSINIDKTTAPADVATVIATLTMANADTLTGILNLSSDSTAGISFQNVPVGTWNLVVIAKSSTGTILYSGQASVVVNQSATTNVALTLNPVVSGEGSISITVNWGTSGLGNAIFLDGFTGFVEVPNSASISSIDTAITIEAWVAPADQYYNTIVCKGLANYGIELAGYLDPGIFLTGVTAPDANYYWGRIMVPDYLTANQWSHIAITYSVSTGVNAYLNSSIVYSTPATGLIQPGTPDLRISARVDSTYTEYFNGGIDDVRIWRIVRTQNDIIQNMNKELTGSESGLVAYWKFDEQPGSTVLHDATSNHNDGTIHGTVTLASWLGH